MIIKWMIPLFFSSFLSGQFYDSPTQKLLDEGKEIFRKGMGYSEIEFKDYEKIFIFYSGRLKWDEGLINVLNNKDLPEIQSYFDAAKKEYVDLKNTNGEYVSQILNGTVSYVEYVNKKDESPETSDAGLKGELSELKNLYDQGLINEEEYQAARKKILDK